MHDRGESGAPDTQSWELRALSDRVIRTGAYGEVSQANGRLSEGMFDLERLFEEGPRDEGIVAGYLAEYYLVGGILFIFEFYMVCV